MKKKVLSIVLSLSMVLGLATASPTSAQAAKTSWQDAYANFLKDPNLMENLMEDGHEKDDTTFALYDMDKDGKPELFIFIDSIPVWHILTFNDGLKDIWTSARNERLKIPDNPKLSGVFSTLNEGPHSYIEYRTLKNKFKAEHVWYHGLKWDSTQNCYSKKIETKVYNAKLKAEFDKSHDLTLHSINIFNIADIIYNYSKTNTAPHPYATALRDYFKYLTQLHNKTADGTTTNLTSYLVDINGDGTNEMLAVDAKYHARLFYLLSGKLRSYDLPILNENLGFSANNRIVITHSSDVGDASWIYTIKNGKATSDILSIDSDDNGNFTGYEHNNKKISESTYKSLTKTYGLANGLTSVYKRPDQTTQILAMEADKVTSLKVTIKGTAKVGKILTAKVTPSSTKISYQWYADGVGIKKATKPTFKVTSAQIGKTITVKVIGTVKGGKKGSAKSKGVKVMK